MKCKTLYSRLARHVIHHLYGTHIVMQVQTLILERLINGKYIDAV